MTQTTLPNASGSMDSPDTPRLSDRTGSYVWGTAGLYYVADGRLTQLSVRPVVDCLPDEADVSLVIISYEPDEHQNVMDG